MMDIIDHPAALTSPEIWAKYDSWDQRSNSDEVAVEQFKKLKEWILLELDKLCSTFSTEPIFLKMQEKLEWEYVDHFAELIKRKEEREKNA